jgi:hypothetical protein
MMRSLWIVFVLSACWGDEAPEDKTPTYPHLAVRAEQKAEILDRLNEEPFKTLYERVVARADQPYREADPELWDWRTYNTNACIAQDSAFLAWLHGDETRATKARLYFSDLATDYERHNSWDLNIRIPYLQVCGVQAWDFLMGSGFFPAEEAAAAEDKLCIIAQKFYDQYLLDPFFRYIALEVTQNNHPLRTASMLALTGIAFPDHPGAEDWLGWALAEYDYLFQAKGHYIQSEGGVSEGPHYYFFGLGAVMAALIAADNGWDAERSLRRNCITRNARPPWNGGDCIENSFTFDNPLHRPLFAKAMDWSIALRMSDGSRPSIADSGRHSPNGIALMGGFGEGKPYHIWDWLENDRHPLKTTGSMELTLHHLAHLPRPLVAAPPPWLNRFLPDSGYAIFRSGWDRQARLAVLMAEHGPARLTLHDHVDGTSFLVEAYGEYLVLDTGYFKPDDLNNALTAHAAAHNVILIDGRGAPRKGLLNNWGGADAFLENSIDAAKVAYAEVRQSYENTEITRGMAFIGQRYWVIADRLTTDVAELREHRWRLHAGAGRDLAGSVQHQGDQAQIIRPNARLDLALASPAGPLVFEAPPFAENEAPYVHDINGHGHHEVLDGLIHAVQPSFLAVLLPSPTGDDDASQERIDAPAGSVAYRVRIGNREDILWLREASCEGALNVGGRRIDSDGFLTVLIGDGAGLLVRGQNLSIDGAPVVALAQPQPVHAWQLGD